MGTWTDREKMAQLRKEKGYDDDKLVSFADAMGGKDALRAIFANLKDPAVREASLYAFDHPEAPPYYWCPDHPMVRVPITYRNGQPFPHDCPMCVASDKPLPTRLDSPDPDVALRAHRLLLQALDGDRLSRQSEGNPWPSWSEVEEAPPSWWPRDADGNPTHTGQMPGPDDLYSALNEIRTGRRHGLFVHGQAGVGKTHAVRRLVASAWKARDAVLLISERRLADIASAAKSGKDEWAAAAARDATDCRIVVVDECGRVNSWTGARGDWYEEWLNHRYEHRRGSGNKGGLVTVFVSNVASETLGESRGQTVKSRIKGICGPDLFVFGPDLRNIGA